jgi:hypothetical protein
VIPRVKGIVGAVVIQNHGLNFRYFWFVADYRLPKESSAIKQIDRLLFINFYDITVACKLERPADHQKTIVVTVIIFHRDFEKYVALIFEF